MREFNARPRGALLALAIGLCAAVAAPGHAQSPAMPYGEAVAARFPPPPVAYDTPGLQPGRTHFTSNDELGAALQALAGRRAAQLLDLGRSATGQPLQALHFSRGAGRPAVLLIGQQHGNEPAAGEAMLVVAQRLADARDSMAAVLDTVDVVLMPRANPDGALTGRRDNGAGLDINRDHLLLRTPEARALAALAMRFQPVLVVDAHEHVALGRYMPKFGAIKRHDLLLQLATTPHLSPALVDAGDTWFRQPLQAVLAQRDLTSDWYHTNPTAADDLRLTMGGVLPDLARNAAGLRHAVSVLLESRGFDLGRLHLARRVHTHVVAIEVLLRGAAMHAPQLVQLRDAAAAAAAATSCEGELVLEAGPTLERREVLMLDPETGADKPVWVDWASALQLRTLATRPRPCGYWLAPGQDAAVERLRLLGVQVRPLAAGTELVVERYRETSRGDGMRRDVLGRVRDPAAVLRLTVDLVPDTIAAPPGSHYVPLDQPLAHLAAVALEPDTQSSYVAHRVVDDLAAVARVVKPPR